LPRDTQQSGTSANSPWYSGWLASGCRRTADQIVAARERYRAAGGRRAIVCFDDAVVLIEPGGPDPERVGALLP
jgi:hypothetical protein